MGDDEPQLGYVEFEMPSSPVGKDVHKQIRRQFPSINTFTRLKGTPQHMWRGEVKCAHEARADKPGTSRPSLMGMRRRFLIPKNQWRINTQHKCLPHWRSDKLKIEQNLILSLKMMSLFICEIRRGRGREWGRGEEVLSPKSCGNVVKSRLF